MLCLDVKSEAELSLTFLFASAQPLDEESLLLQLFLLLLELQFKI